MLFKLFNGNTCKPFIICKIIIVTELIAEFHTNNVVISSKSVLFFSVFESDSLVFCGDFRVQFETLEKKLSVACNACNVFFSFWKLSRWKKFCRIKLTREN